MVEVVVTGIGLLSCLGSLTSSWENLVLGKSGVKVQQPFRELPPTPLGLIAKESSRLDTLTRKIVAAALKDAQITPPVSDCAVVVGSSRGCQAQWEQMLRNRGKQQGKINPHLFTSDTPWLETLPQQAAIVAARQLGSQGIVLAPTAACATGIWAVARGMELIKTGQCQQVIAGAVEAPVTPLTLAGFAKMGALATTGCYPFDRQRQGLALAEGGAIFVLESEISAQRRNVPIYGQLLGFGLTSDAYHVSAPHPYSRGAITAVKQCLERSALEATEIDYIHAHGTSTRLNDRHEAQLIEHLFPQKVALSSTKGATGHTLGASGVMGLAFCLLAIKHQKLPPCVGLKEPEFDLNLVREVRSAKVRHVLCFSFGFGGQNAVLSCSERK